MNEQIENDKVVSSWKATLKKGKIFLVIAGLIFLAAYGMHEARVVRGGVVFGLFSLGWIVCGILGIVYLIKGQVGKSRWKKGVV